MRKLGTFFTFQGPFQSKIAKCHFFISYFTLSFNFINLGFVSKPVYTYLRYEKIVTVNIFACNSYNLLYELNLAETFYTGRNEMRDKKPVHLSRFGINRLTPDLIIFLNFRTLLRSKELYSHREYIPLYE